MRSRVEEEGRGEEEGGEGRLRGRVEEEKKEEEEG